MENKTVTYNGKVYEIGKHYLFFDEIVDSSRYGELADIDESDRQPFKRGVLGGVVSYRYIAELPESESFGTITGAPIELKDGCAYVFESHGNEYIGVYDHEHNRFLGFAAWLVSEVKNIREMVVKDDS